MEQLDEEERFRCGWEHDDEGAALVFFQLASLGHGRLADLAGPALWLRLVLAGRSLEKAPLACRPRSAPAAGYGNSRLLPIKNPGANWVPQGRCLIGPTG